MSADEGRPEGTASNNGAVLSRQAGPFAEQQRSFTLEFKLRERDSSIVATKRFETPPDFSDARVGSQRHEELALSVHGEVE